MQNGVAEQDAADLMQVMRALSAGWNAGSAAAFVAGMTEDTHYVAFDGSVLEGASEIEAFHQPAFDTHLRGTELQIDVTGMRALGEHSFVVFATGGAIRREGGPRDLTGDSVQTFICQRIDATMRVTVFQNTRIRPLRGPAAAAAWRGFDTLWATSVGTLDGRLQVWATSVEQGGAGGGPPPGSGPPSEAR